MNPYKDTSPSTPKYSLKELENGDNRFASLIKSVYESDKAHKTEDLISNLQKLAQELDCLEENQDSEYNNRFLIEYLLDLLCEYSDHEILSVLISIVSTLSYISPILGSMIRTEHLKVLITCLKADQRLQMESMHAIANIIGESSSVITILPMEVWLSLSKDFSDPRELIHYYGSLSRYGIDQKYAINVVKDAVFLLNEDIHDTEYILDCLYAIYINIESIDEPYLSDLYQQHFNPCILARLFEFSSIEELSKAAIRTLVSLVQAKIQEEAILEMSHTIYEMFAQEVPETIKAEALSFVAATCLKYTSDIPLEVFRAIRETTISGTVHQRTGALKSAVVLLDRPILPFWVDKEYVRALVDGMDAQDSLDFTYICRILLNICRSSVNLDELFDKNLVEDIQEAIESADSMGSVDPTLCLESELLAVLKKSKIE